MRVLVTSDYRALSLQAAQIVAEAVCLKPDLVLCLPTGNTPLGMYEELVRRHRQEGLDFSRVRTFNLDEYIGLGPDHPGSYRAYMRLHFFGHVTVAQENIHIPNETESDDYEQAILEAGGLDLLIVGIGANGHIAFNEPGSSFASRTRAVALATETLANARRHFDNEADVPLTAVTVGIRTILDARQVLLLASSADKAAVVERAIRGPVSESLPASALQLHPNVLAILDQAAAECLR
ncbi:MAG: glucosamine-6-phosphate deaminase [Acidobacteria bacterium]|nr:MAG: glucosamine-6-phosphate deaminase [Acidobacteriota bacterium]